MTIQYLANRRITGLVADTKPTSVQTNTIFEELDSGRIFLWNGSSWISLDKTFFRKTFYQSSFMDFGDPPEYAPWMGGDIINTQTLDRVVLTVPYNGKITKISLDNIVTELLEICYLYLPLALSLLTSGGKIGSSYVTRYGQKIDTSHTGIGKKFKDVGIILKKVGTPTGTCVVKVYDGDGSTVVATSNTFKVSDLSTIFNTTLFLLDSVVTVEADTRVVVEYSGGDSSNYIEIALGDTAGGAGANTTQTEWNGSSWTSTSTLDCVMYFPSYVKTASNGNFTITMVVRKNGVDQSMSLTSSATGLTSSTSNPVSFSAGDTIVIKLSLSGGTSGTYHFHMFWDMELENT